MLDEMLSPAIAEQLTGAGIDTIAVSAMSDLAGQPDSEVLEAAHRLGCVLVTENVRDFAPLAQSWMAHGRAHPGIVLIGSRAIPHGRGKPGAIVSALLRMHAANELPSPGHLVFLRA